MMSGFGAAADVASEAVPAGTREGGAVEDGVEVEMVRFGRLDARFEAIEEEDADCDRPDVEADEGSGLPPAYCTMSLFPSSMNVNADNQNPVVSAMDPHGRGFAELTEEGHSGRINRLEHLLVV